MAECLAIDDIRPGIVIDTDEQQRAETIHKNLVNYGFQVRRFVRNLCVDLSVMHDDKLYTLLGYTNFYEYCSQALNIEATQAKKYVTVGVFCRTMELSHPGDEKVTNCNNFSDLGIEKMYLIATLKTPEYEVLKQEGEFYSLSKRELKKKIESIKLDQKQREDKNFNGDLNEFRKMVDNGTEEHNKEVASASLPAPNSDCPAEFLEWYRLILSLESVVLNISNYYDLHSDVLSDMILPVYFNRINHSIDLDKSYCEEELYGYD